MLRKLTCILLLLLVAGCGKKTYPSSRLKMPAGNFSYVTPDGWGRTKLAGIDFLIVSTDEDYGIKPNIFIDGVFEQTSLTNAIDQICAKKQDDLKDYTIKQQSNFTTQSRLTGIKIEALHTNYQNLPLTTFNYLIQDADRIISITCTCADAVKSKYELLFDTAIKSIRPEPEE